MFLKAKEVFTKIEFTEFLNRHTLPLGPTGDPSQS